MNSELYRGYYKEDKQSNKIASGFTIPCPFFCPLIDCVTYVVLVITAYDLTSSDLNNFNLVVSYNSTYRGATQIQSSIPALSSLSLSPRMLRLPRLLNLVICFLKLEKIYLQHRYIFHNIYRCNKEPRCNPPPTDPHTPQS